MIHIAYLMTVPDLVKELGGLYRVIDMRTELFHKMLKLEGRLSVVCDQIRLREKVGKDEEEENEEDEAQRMGFVYNENGRCFL